MKKVLVPRENKFNKNFEKRVIIFEMSVDFFDNDIFLLKVYIIDGIVFIVHGKIKR